MIRSPRALLTAMALAPLLGCGGGSPPTTPPSPTPEPGHTVMAVVYYDENGNGGLEPDERMRVPDVEVAVAGRSARSEKLTGRAVVSGVPAGMHAIAVRAETLPPFYQAGPSATVTVPPPDGTTAMLPLTLPIGGNRPNVYMAFGDSITFGDELPLSAAYPARLEARLRSHFGDAAEVVNRGAGGTNTFESLERLLRNLRINEPAYTLILYGTNDWHDPACQEDPRCHTVPNLRQVVQGVKAFRSLPFLATLPPVNPTLNPPGRNQWIAEVNDQIRVMAREEGAFLVDAHRAFMREPDLSRLFLDHVHLSPAGHELLASVFFEAIAHGRSEP